MRVAADAVADRHLNKAGFSPITGHISKSILGSDLLAMDITECFKVQNKMP